MFGEQFNVYKNILCIQKKDTKLITLLPLSRLHNHEKRKMAKTSVRDFSRANGKQIQGVNVVLFNGFLLQHLNWFLQSSAAPLRVLISCFSSVGQLHETWVNVCTEANLGHIYNSGELFDLRCCIYSPLSAVAYSAGRCKQTLTLQPFCDLENMK